MQKGDTAFVLRLYVMSNRQYLLKRAAPAAESEPASCNWVEHSVASHVVSGETRDLHHAVLPEEGINFVAYVDPLEV